MAGNVAAFTDSNFQADVLSSGQPVLVDFWAPWCGPCKMIAPTIDAIATDFEGKVKVGKVNTDDNQQVASEYGISSIPALLVFKNGQVVDKMVGVVSKDKLAACLNKHVA